MIQERLDQMREMNPARADLLGVLAVGTRIPVALFGSKIEHSGVPASLVQLFFDRERADKEIEALRDLGLAEFDADVVAMPPHMAESFQDQLDEERSRYYQEIAKALLS